MSSTLNYGRNKGARIEPTLNKRKYNKETFASKLKRSALQPLQRVLIPTLTPSLPALSEGEHSALEMSVDWNYSNDLADIHPTACNSGDLDSSSLNNLEEEKDKQANSSVSTFSSSNVFPFMQENICIGFENDQQLVFVGYALIGVLAGSIDINGATISSNVEKPAQLEYRCNSARTITFYPVFSSKNTSMAVVKSIPHVKTFTATHPSTPEYTINEIEKLVDYYKGKLDRLQTIIIIKKLEWDNNDDTNFQLDGLDAYVSNDGPFYDDVAGFQPIISVTPGIKTLEIQDSWPISVDQLLEYEQDHFLPTVSMICGGKHVGKSSFARYTINRLLKTHRRVAYLETDIHKPEFTSPGYLSLHIIDNPLLGPPSTHNKHRCRDSQHVGTTCTSSQYKKSLKKLYKSYNQESEEWIKIAMESNYHNLNQLLPLIINTSGWTEEPDMELLTTIMEKVKTTHVFIFICPSDVDFPGLDLDNDFTKDRQLIRLYTSMTAITQVNTKD